MLTSAMTERKIIRIPIIQIRQNNMRTRHEYQQKDLRDLARSINSVGILCPLLVRKVSQSEYEIIDGERRLRAAVICGIKKVQCIVLSCTDREAGIRTLAANLSRSETDIFDTALAMQKLIDKHEVNTCELADTLGRSQTDIKNELRLLELTDEEIGLARKYGLKRGHIFAALKLKDKTERHIALSEIIEGGMNVIQSENYISELIAGRKEKLRMHQKRTLILKTNRILENTLNKAINTINESGLNVKTEQTETNSYIEYRIKVEKTPGKLIGMNVKTA